MKRKLIDKTLCCILCVMSAALAAYFFATLNGSWARLTIAILWSVHAVIDAITVMLIVFSPDDGGGDAR